VLQAGTSRPQTPNYSSYTEPEARVVTPFHQTTPAEAAAVPGQRKGKVDQGAPDIEDQIAKARKVYDTAQRGERADVLGTNKEKHGKVQRMTWEEYNKLTPTQRAAIDFNTMLVRAVRKDLENAETYEPNPDQRKVYDRTAEKMFGSEDRTSETYAPETLAVLKQINYKDTAGDLDDFLGLRAAITAKDLKNLPLLQSTSPDAVRSSDLTSGELEATTLKYGLATSTQAMEQKLAEGVQLLANMPRTAAHERRGEVGRLGGILEKENPQLGFAPGKYSETGAPVDVNTYFQEAFAKLSAEDTSQKTADLLGRIESDLSPDEFMAFKSYADIRTNNAQRFGVDLGEQAGIKYRSPEEYRDLLGLGEGTPNG
jgi:hypothetical protein